VISGLTFSSLTRKAVDDYGIHRRVIKLLTLLLPSKGQPIHQVKCNLKEIAGELNDNPELKAEGTGEKLDGKVQEKICKI